MGPQMFLTTFMKIQWSCLNVKLDCYKSPYKPSTQNTDMVEGGTLMPKQKRRFHCPTRFLLPCGQVKIHSNYCAQKNLQDIIL